MSDTQDDIETKPAGQPIFREGDRASCAYVVLAGRVKVVKSHGFPDETVIGHVEPDDILGEMGPLDDAPRSATAIPEVDTRLRRVDRADFLRYISTNPAAARNVMERLSDRLRRASALRHEGSVADATPYGTADARDEGHYRRPNRPGRTAFLASIGLLAAAACSIAAAAVTEVETVVSARGKVVSNPPTAKVEAETTGRLDQISVDPGDSVSAGETLATLRAPKARAELKAANAELDATRTRLRRLRAEARVLDGEDVETPDNEVLERRLEGHRTRMAELGARLQSAKARIKRSNRVLEAARRSARLQESRFERKRKLADRGAVPRTHAREAERALAEAVIERAEASRDLESAKTAHAQAEAKRASYLAGRRAEVAEQIERAAERRGRLAARAEHLGQKVKDHRIASPVAGEVARVPVERAGTTVDPKDVVAEIVPADAPLLVEADVSPADVEGVGRGMPASVKLDALPFQRFGDIPGSVAFLSPDTKETDDPDGRRKEVYTARVTLNAQAPENAPEDFALKPGMTASADLVTGSRTVLSYVTDPLTEALSTAFREPR